MADSVFMTRRLEFNRAPGACRINASEIMRQWMWMWMVGTDCKVRREERGCNVKGKRPVSSFLALFGAHVGFKESSRIGTGKIMHSSGSVDVPLIHHVVFLVLISVLGRWSP